MSNRKPQKALQLGLNVLIDQNCEGGNCNWHEFPYEFNSILSNDKRKLIKFNNIDDVWDYIDLLCQESEQRQKEGGSFSNLNNIWEQLPFFVCRNKIINKNAQKDIAKYVYCKDTNTPLYPGSYGDVPSVWLQKYYIIRNAINLRDQKLTKKAKDGND